MIKKISTIVIYILLFNLNCIYSQIKLESNHYQPIKHQVTKDLLFSKTFQRYSNAGWLNSSREKYSYDENNNLISEISQVWERSNWVNDEMTTSKYDESGQNMTENMESFWKDEAWDTAYVYHYSYSDTLLIAYHSVKYASDTHYNYYQYSFFYDDNNNQVEHQQKQWRGYEWQDHFILNTKYDEMQNIIEEIFKWWTNNQWINQTKWEKSYNDNLMVKQIISNGDVDKWKVSSDVSYKYDTNGNLVESIQRSLQDTTWHNGIKYNYSYTSNNLIGEMFYESWDWITNDWRISNRYKYIYNENNQLDTLLQYTEDDFNWRLNARWLHEYQIATNLSAKTNLMDGFSLEQNYPNPFNPKTQISYSIKDEGPVELSVYSVLGEKIIDLVNENQSAGDYKVSFNAEHLVSGIYFYTITSGDYHSTKKMILLK